MSPYRENAKPLEVEDFIGKYIKMTIYSGEKNGWFGIFKGAQYPTDAKPFWTFTFSDISGENEILVIPRGFGFGIETWALK